METVTRGNTVPTVVSVGIVSLAFVVTSQVSIGAKVFFFLFLLGVVAILGRLIHRDIIKAADRLRDLEAKVNQVAGGEELLEWETRFAAGKTPFLRDLFLPSRWRFGPN
jgi:hypothetical protein